jgi:hypothetical protein
MLAICGFTIRFAATAREAGTSYGATFITRRRLQKETWADAEGDILIAIDPPDVTPGVPTGAETNLSRQQGSMPTRLSWRK